MAARDITDLSTIKGAQQSTTGADDVALQKCLTAASRAIEIRTGRRLKSASYNQWHSGDRAVRYQNESQCVDRAMLFLADPETRLATLPVSAVTSVTENGTALTVVRLQQVSTLPTSGELAVVDDAQGRIIRASAATYGFTPKAWQSGIANIRVVCTAGYDHDASNPNMPDEIVQVCAELTWLMYQEGRRTGVEQMAAAGMDVRFIRFLPPNSKTTLQLFDLRWSPSTLEG